MNQASLYVVLGYATGGLFLAVAIGVLLWCRLARRTAEPRLCPKCDYDLSGVPGLRDLKCPECGRVTLTRSALRRAPRRRAIKVLAVALILAGAGLFLAAYIQQRGWHSMVPNELLVRIVSVTRDPSGQFDRLQWELLSRNPSNPLSARQRSVLLDRAAAASIRLRPRWPAGVPIRAWLDPEAMRFMSGLVSPTQNAPTKLALSEIQYTTVRSALQNSVWIAAGFEPWRREGADQADYDFGAQVIGDAPPERRGLVDIVFDMHIRGMTSGDLSKRVPPEDGRLITAARATLPLRIVPSIDDCITPNRDAAIDSAIKDGLTIALAPGWTRFDAQGKPQFRRNAHIYGTRAFSTALTGRGLALRIEFVRDGAVIAWARLLKLTAIEWPRFTDPGLGVSTVVMGDEAAVFEALADPSQAPRWLVRITGDGELALRDPDATTYWAGEVLLPWSAVSRIDPAVR